MRPSPVLLVRGLPVLALALGACTGVVSEPSRTVEVQQCVDTGPSPGETPLRRLTQLQYENSVHELLGDGVTVGTPLAFSGGPGTYSTVAELNNVSGAVASGLNTDAEAIALEVTGDASALLGCDPNDETGCVQPWIAGFVQRAYRRPLVDGELAIVTDLYATLRTMDTVPQALAGVIELVLQSPQFLYLDVGGVDDADGVQRMSDHAIASRLSYFLWDSMPDQALLDAAADGALHTPEQVGAQARRMLEGPRGHEVLARFHREWLGLARPEAIGRDTDAYPTFSTELVRALYDETDRFVEHVVWTEGGGVRDLLSSNVVFANPTIEAYYGLESRSGGADEWVEQSLPDERYRGVLTRGAFLTNRANTASSNPIQRGVFVLRRLLCQDLEAPNNVDTTLADSPDGVIETVRDRFAAHRDNPACASCHQLIDPIGFAFESYDGIGQYREVYPNGLSVDASGTWPESSTAFDGAPTMVDALVQDPTITTCYTEQLLAYGLGRAVTDRDRCSVARLAAPIGDEEPSILDLVVGITQSDAFLYRTPPDLTDPVSEEN